ncbi:Hypothetical_protein [Hexamita inflata]|uniref:Hypothetical_protein n=1 Tax=Hexamita inflata TaxID=28002 RepID=A0AA86VAH9_9EUKA|nr:Hypothetical protein HINF_LOCUS48798 [Hexamita inflata]
MSIYTAITLTVQHCSFEIGGNILKISFWVVQYLAVPEVVFSYGEFFKQRDTIKEVVNMQNITKQFSRCDPLLKASPIPQSVTEMIKHKYKIIDSIIQRFLRFYAQTSFQYNFSIISNVQKSRQCSNKNRLTQQVMYSHIPFSSSQYPYGELQQVYTVMGGGIAFSCLLCEQLYIKIFCHFQCG